MRKCTLVLGFIIVTGFITRIGSATVTPDSISEYFREVAELVIKRDSEEIYKRMTPEVQQKFSAEYIADFLNKALGDIGEPVSATITGFQINPDQEFSRVEGLLEFSKGKILLGLVLKSTPGGFRIHYLNINYPEGDVHGQKRIQAFAADAKDFLKEKFFETLKKEGPQGAINFVDGDVRKRVGDELITLVLEKLRDIEITGIQNYAFDSTENGLLHKFLLSGLTNDKENCQVEIILRGEKDNFQILDVNVYTGGLN